MDARKIKRKLNLQAWAEQIKAQQESGMSIRDWCKANNVSTSTFSLRQRKVREAVLDVNKDLSMANAAINMAHVQLMGHTYLLQQKVNTKNGQKCIKNSGTIEWE